MMEKLEVEFKTVTPMFLGNASGKSAELRPSSLKGIIRFWWRALHANLSTKELYAKESELFGTANVDEARGVGRSKLILHIKHKKGFAAQSVDSKNLPASKATDPHWYSQVNMDVFKYLAFGKYDFNTGFFPYIKQDTNFTVDFLFPAEYKKDILQVLECLHRFACLGGKSRNGFGSLWISKLNGDKYDWRQMGPTIKKSIFGDRIPSFSGFSGQARLFITKANYPSWNAAHAALGDAYRYNRLEVEGQKHHYANRVYLASPLQKAKETQISDRRAKPFFFKVLREGNNFRGQVLYLPAEYGGFKKKASSHNSNPKKQLDAKFLEICDEFLEKMKKSPVGEFMEIPL